MSTQLLIYGQAVAINKDTHIDLSIKAENSYSFAKAVNSVPLMTVEFLNAMKDYPIVFAGEGEELTPIVVMGVRDEENLYVTDDGQWQADYIPAFIRRYPFVFAASDDDDTLTLCLDETYSGCNRDGRGERLFDADGEKTQYLDNVLNFLQDYQAQNQLTRAFCKKLVELDLFEDVGAKFTLANGDARTLTGFKVIKREKMKELDKEQLAELMANDSLELIYAHLHSTQNLQKLVQLVPQEDKS